WVNAPIIRPSVAHHMSLYVKNYTQLRHVTNQVPDCPFILISVKPSQFVKAFFADIHRASLARGAEFRQGA
ncbi:MAG: hypothetical protein Q7J20_10490, partial [Candidatus Nitrotoga sp.]|nr:hypothetical protein [Candidatus Nitrotoga sp.]